MAAGRVVCWAMSSSKATVNAGLWIGSSVGSEVWLPWLAMT